MDVRLDDERVQEDYRDDSTLWLWVDGVTYEEVTRSDLNRVLDENTDTVLLIDTEYEVEPIRLILTSEDVRYLLNQMDDQNDSVEE